MDNDASEAVQRAKEEELLVIQSYDVTERNVKGRDKNRRRRRRGGGGGYYLHNVKVFVRFI